MLIHQKLEEIHEALRAEYNRLFIDYENNYNEITLVESIIKQYIETDQKEFEYHFFDEEEGEELTTFLDIEQLLTYKRDILCKNLLEFFEQPKEESFKEIIKNTYLLYLSFVVSYYKSQQIYERYEELCSLHILSLSMFPLKEQPLFFQTFYHHIKKVNLFRQRDFHFSLLPLAFKLSNNYLNLPETLNVLKFNEIYQNTFNHYLSKNDTLTEKTFHNLCNYHMKKSNNNTRKENLPIKDGRFIAIDVRPSEFRIPLLQAFPMEVISLVKLRVLNNLNIDCIHHPLINDFLPFLKKDINFHTNDSLGIKNKIFKDYNIKIN